MAVFEIVPNLSEGRSLETIDRAVAAVHATGAKILHRTSDEVHHRSVLTIAGGAREVLAAALAVAGVAIASIDLRKHRGVHPRIGALDVLPFVPLADASMSDAVSLAHEAGEAIWERHGVPCFFYGWAARSPERESLARIRSGEFKPDIGNAAHHESAGAVAVGARSILVAFNVELATGDLHVARAIARAMRERDGGLRTLRALGFRLGEERVQVSFNVTDYEATPLHTIVELVRSLAAAHGVAVTRGELIGCLPQAAVEASARYYLGIPAL